MTDPEEPTLYAVPKMPRAMHWLGDRAEAAGTGHAKDDRGVVMYFETPEQAQAFMEWIVDMPITD